MGKVYFCALIFIGQDAFGAVMKCVLSESNIAVASYEHVVSVDSDPSSFKFSDRVNGNDYEASLDWDTEVLHIHIKKKTDSFGGSSWFFWDRPFQASVGLTHGNSSMSCYFDVGDGLSYAWKRFRSQVADDEKWINLALKDLSDFTKIIPTNSREEEQINAAICLFVGYFQKNQFMIDLQHKLIRLSSDAVSTKIFPKAFDYYETLSIKTLGLVNFCAEGAIKGDQNPIPFQDKTAFANRCSEISTIVRQTIAYLDQQFPN